jgi:hypothetical protein
VLLDGFVATLRCCRLHASIQARSIIAAPDTSRPNPVTAICYAN